jgi:hypothetical protein
LLFDPFLLLFDPCSIMRTATLVAILALTLAGCQQNSGPVTVPLQGSLLMNGAPLEVKGREIGLGQVALEFIPADDTGPAPQTYGVQAGVDGKFTFAGGIKPGKYKVAVYQWDPYPMVDKLQGAYSKERTTIVRDVDGKTPIDIDLAKLQ